jgi:hypothetical protein
MLTLEELREEIWRRIAEAKANIEACTTALEIAKAELRAHDAAVEAASAGLLARPQPLGPDNLNGGRAQRRNIPETVYELLSQIPQTTDELAERVGGVKISQIQGALLKLGDKVATEAVNRPRNGVPTVVPGYLLPAREPQHE